MTPVFEQEYARGRQRYPQPEPQFKLGGDEIGISHKGTWPVVITVKERDEKGRVVPKEVLRVSTGEHNNFWCSMFIVTRADGTAPIPPVVIHQAKERTVAHLHAIPSDWLVLTSPSGYMTKELYPAVIAHCLKYMPKVGNNVYYWFQDGHDSHFSAQAMEWLMYNGEAKISLHKDAAPAGAGDAEPAGAGDAAPADAGDAAPAGAGDAAPADAGDAAPADAGDAEPAGAGDAAPAGAGDAEPAGAGDAEPAGAGDAAPAEEPPFCHIFFLRSQASMDDQPNDLGPNACFKSCYKDALADWHERNPNVEMIAPLLNVVIVDAWSRFVKRCARAIESGWRKAGLEPYDPLAFKRLPGNGAAAAAIADPAPPETRVHDDARVVKDALDKHSKKFASTLANTVNEKLPEAVCDSELRAQVMKEIREAAKAGVRSAMLTVTAIATFQKSFVRPAQEIADELKTIRADKKRKTSTATTELLTNPSTTAGRHVTAQLLIDTAKTEKKKREIERAKELASAAAENARATKRVRLLEEGRPLYETVQSMNNDAQKEIAIARLSHDDLKKLARFMKSQDPALDVSISGKKADLCKQVCDAVKTCVAPAVRDDAAEAMEVC